MSLESEFISRRDLVNQMIHELSPEKRQLFYEELGRLRIKGMHEEAAIAKAFEKLGMENPFQSMKITVGKQTLFGIRKGRGQGRR